jgi:retinol dehydrogenase 12
MGFFIGRKTTEGAKTIVWAALAGHDNPAVRENLRGAYTANCALSEPSDYVLSKEGQEAERRIWVSAITQDNGHPDAHHDHFQDETLQILVKVDPRVRVVVGQHLKA